MGPSRPRSTAGSTAIRPLSRTAGSEWSSLARKGHTTAEEGPRPRPVFACFALVRGRWDEWNIITVGAKLQVGAARPTHRMKIVIAGGSGFLGTPLAWTWAEEGHDVWVLTRALPVGQAQHESGTGRPGITRVGWRPDGTAVTVGQELERADAVINLA